MNFNPTLQLLPGLPAYAGGRMSDAPYHAGAGHHGLYRDGNPCEYNWQAGDNGPDVFFRYFTYAGYTPDAPCDGDHFGPVTLSDGFSDFTIARQGTRLTFAQTRAPYALDEPVWARAVTETTPEAFLAYIDLLQSEGFARCWENRIEDNLFFSLSRDGRRIHAAYCGGEQTARFIDDPLSAPIETFGGGDPIPGEKTQLCQFALRYGEMIPHVTADCGMLYLMKLPDNSMILIDGGEIGQATDAACREVMRLMRAMTRTPEGEKIRVAAWLCTHAHDDHMDLFNKLMRFYHDEFTLERAIFNFPHWEHFGVMPQSYVMMSRLQQYYPEVRYLKAHTGQKFTLAGVDFEVLLTHEDWAGPTGQEHSPDLNDTSLVVKITFDGASFLLLGDINRQAEDKLLARYTEKTLRCACMQAAHHLINQLPKLYPLVQPQIALVSQHICSAVETNPQYRILCATVPPQNQYYASCATDIFESHNGRMALKQRLFPRGDIYDHSQV